MRRLATFVGALAVGLLAGYVLANATGNASALWIFGGVGGVAGLIMALALPTPPRRAPDRRGDDGGTVIASADGGSGRHKDTSDAGSDGGDGGGGDGGGGGGGGD